MIQEGQVRYQAESTRKTTDLSPMIQEGQGRYQEETTRKTTDIHRGDPVR